MKIEQHHRHHARALVRDGFGAEVGYLAAVELIDVEQEPVGPCPTWSTTDVDLHAYTTPDGSIAVQNDGGEEVSTSAEGARELAYALLALADMADAQRQDQGAGDERR